VGRHITKLTIAIAIPFSGKARLTEKTLRAQHIKLKVKIILEQATKAQRVSSCVPLLFL